MDNSINKEEALKALDRIFDNCEEIDWHISEEERTGYNMLEDISLLRSYIYSNCIFEWISTQDRLPETEGYYLVSINSSPYHTVRGLYFAPSRDPAHKSLMWRTEEGYVYSRLVLAWMPLPSPYEPKE